MVFSINQVWKSLVYKVVIGIDMNIGIDIYREKEDCQDSDSSSLPYGRNREHEETGNHLC